MPYRIDPNDRTVVQVMRGKKWRKLKKHPTAEKAQAQLSALFYNSHRKTPVGAHRITEE